MDAAKIRKQVEYVVSKGWSPAVEHTEPENAFDHYWYMWKLPMFGALTETAGMIAVDRDAGANALRALMRDGEAFPRAASLASLRALGSSGEPWTPEAWWWLACGKLPAWRSRSVKTR